MQHLTGLIEATRDLPTPLLAIDAAVLERNISRMQSDCDRSGVALRPHIKTHKSSAIAQMQLDAGAVGVTCATFSEAVALAEAGCSTDVFISTPVFIDQPKRRLLGQAVEMHQRLTLTVDSKAVAEPILEFVPPEVKVMIEVDCGLGRTGLPPEQAAALARTVGHRLAGFATHGGHGYRPKGAPAAGGDERRALALAQTSLGSPVDVLSAGSTPTARHASGSPVTELRPGTYVFGDHQQVRLDACQPADVAAAVVATVIHASRGRFVIDAGAKALSKDRADWIASYGHVVGYPNAIIDRLNDNHGMAVCDVGPAVGDRVVVVPNHICPVVNLFDDLQVVGRGPTHTLAVDLRGRLT